MYVSSIDFIKLSKRTCFQSVQSSLILDNDGCTLHHQKISLTGCNHIIMYLFTHCDMLTRLSCGRYLKISKTTSSHRFDSPMTYFVDFGFAVVGSWVIFNVFVLLLWHSSELSSTNGLFLVWPIVRNIFGCTNAQQYGHSFVRKRPRNCWTRNLCD